MTWILVLALYSPGGDLVESHNFLYWDKESCLEKSRTWRGRDAMGLRKKAYCLQKIVT